MDKKDREKRLKEAQKLFSEVQENAWKEIRKNEDKENGAGTYEKNQLTNKLTI